MILTALLIAGAVLLAPVIYLLATTAVRNYRAHKFFEKKSPNLPVLPNPKLLSGHFDELIYAFDGWKKVELNHEKYGDSYGWFYRDKPIVSTIDLDLIKTIHLDQSNVHINNLSTDTPIDEIEIDCIITAKDEQWRRLRKAYGPAIANHKVKSTPVQAEMLSAAEKLVSHIEQKLNEAKEQGDERSIIANMDDISHRYTLDLVFRCFYKQDDIISYRTERDMWVDMIVESADNLINPLFYLCIIFPSLKPIVRWLIEHFNSLGYVRRKLMNFIEQQAKLNLKAKRELKRAKARDPSQTIDPDNFKLSDGTMFRRNLIDSVIDQLHDGIITKREYLNSTFLLFLAANVTSSAALSKTFYLLAVHPQVQDKLRKSITEHGLESEYLSWVINESMRLYPPALVSEWRQVTHDIESKCGLIPKGTFVAAPTNLTSRLPKYWGDDAQEFKPERWSNPRSFHPAQFLIFGIGTRSCPGKYFATHGIKVILNTLLKRYKLEKVEETVKPALKCSPLLSFTVYEQPVYVKVSPLET